MTSRPHPAAPASALPVPDPLPVLQAEFPAFRIWRESIHGRIRYVARSQHPGARPHTVVTADPGELRAALAPSPSPSPAGVPAGQQS